MRLFASVRADMTGLVLETVEGLLAERALVRPGQIIALVVMGSLCILEQRRHEAYCSGGHGRLSCSSGVDGVKARVGGGRVLLLQGRIVAGRRL
jgi:hypothetical protein